MEAVNTEKKAEYTFRPYRETDVNFILNSWGSSYYKGANYHYALNPDEFHHFHRPIRERLLYSPNIAIIVCCAADAEDLILGWVLVEKSKPRGLIVHYIYVKEAFKGHGIAKELIERALPDRPVFMTHMTDKARKLMRFDFDKYKEFFYTPHLI